ncbi:MAG: ATP-grasp domain-containing protein [Gordonia sp. (in: high G+C Gram-positive bacteria)]
MPVDPRILATTSRMPFAVDEIHKLGEEMGRFVVATDTFREAPGSHSRGVAEALITPPPTQEPDAFVERVGQIIDQESINFVLPMFEEVFYLAANRNRLAENHPGVEFFFADLAALTVLNDKVQFADLCERLGLPVATTVVATTAEELEQATHRWDHWFARAAFGRGGLDVVTNTGPLAAQTSLDGITPSEDDPWLVQEFLTGEDRCSFSVVHHGEVVLHSVYRHPLTIDNRGGIVFESVDAPDTLTAVQKIAKELNYHGQISMDYLMTDDGVHHMVECNPRPTAGVTVATAAELDTALFNPVELVVVPAGRKKQIKAAVLRDSLLHPSKARENFAAAKGAEGVYDQRKDHMPLIYSALSLRHLLAYRKVAGKERSSEQLVAAQFFDVLYDGSPLVQR